MRSGVPYRNGCGTGGAPASSISVMTLDAATGPTTRPARRPAARPAPVPLDLLLARQDGLITREQARAAGLSTADIDERLRLRRWRPLHPRVYVAGDVRPDAGTRMRGALLWAGPTAVLSGPAAAWWHGLLAEPPAQPTVTVGPTAGRRGRSRAGVTVRCRELPAADVIALGGVPVTGLALTVLDTAVALGPTGGRFLDHALRDRVRYAAVREAHRRMRGTPGWARAAVLLDVAAERSGAVAVRELVRLLCATGTVGWVPDPAGVAFPTARVRVAVSGWAQPLPPVNDRPGLRVLRYCWHDIVDRPSIVLAEIATAVAAGNGTRG
jgi:hypothetical protein